MYTISRPVAPIMERGYKSTNHTPWSFRLSRQDAEIIKEAAYECGVTKSTFVRSCAVQAAKQILKENTDGS